MAVELGTGYISVVPETKGFNKAVSGALSGVQGEGDKAGQGLGSKLASGLGTTLKRGVIGTGVAVGAGLAVSITKGIGRLTGIEEAQAKLGGLGHSASSVNAIMNDALASVKGTAFGLQDAATVAASTVAAGIKPGQELQRVLKLTGDAATIAGVSITEMGGVFNKVAASGKMQGDVINQLNDKGIPIVQLLGKQLNKTSAEIYDMSTKGKINFAMFADAMESGLGGAALRSGDTVKGSLANMGAAAGRLGATLAGPFYDRAAGAFGGLTDLLDRLNDSAKPVMEDFNRWLGGTAIPKLGELALGARDTWDAISGSDLVVSSLSRLDVVATSLWSTAQDLWPSVQQVGTSLATAAGATGVSSWQVLLGVLESVAPILDNTLVPALNVTASLMRDNQTAVAALAIGFTAFKTVPSIMAKVTGALSPVTGRVSSAKEAFQSFGEQMKVQEHLAEASGIQLGKLGAEMATLEARVPAIGKMAEAYRGAGQGLSAFSARHGEASAGLKDLAVQSTDAFKSADLLGRAAGNSAASGIATMGRAAAGVGAAGLSGLKSAAGGLINLLGGPLGAGMAVAGLGIAAVSASSSTAKGHTAALKNETDRLASAQVDVAKALRATSGVLDESVSPALEGAIDAMRKSNQELSNQSTGGWSMFGAGLADTWSVMTTSVENWGDATLGANQQAIHSARDSKEAAEEQEKVFTSLGLTNEEVAAKVHGSRGAWKGLEAQLRALGPAGEELATKLFWQRDAVESMQRSMTGVTPGAFELGEAMTILADKSSTASDKTNALRQALQALGIIAPDADQAMFDYAKTIDKLATSAAEVVNRADGFGDALLLDGKLDATVKNARELNDAIVELGGGYQLVASQGGDLNAAWEQAMPVIDGMVTSYGLSRDKVLELAHAQGLVRPEVIARVSLEGADKATVELNNVALHLKAAMGDGTNEVKMRLEDQGVIDTLREAGLKVNMISGSDHMVTIKADDAPLAVTAIDAVIAKAVELDAVEAIADMDINKVRFDIKDADARGQLEAINRSETSAEVNAVIDGLLKGTGVSMAELSKIDKTTAKPEVIAIIDDAMKRAQIVSAELDKAARDRNATIRVEYWTGPNVTAPAGVDPSKIQGPVPIGYATGGKLPTSGPGTDRVDGILGIDHRGMAVARVNRGEWIVNEESSNKHNALIGAINRDDPALADLPAFAGGGRLRDLVDGRSGGASRPLDGAPYDWAGTNWGDCSGAMSAPARAAVGLDPFGGRFATSNQGQYLRDLGFSMGRGSAGDLRFGWYNGGAQGGHTAGTLDDGTNIEMGGGYGGGKVGGTVGADHPQFTEHAYLTVSDGAGPALAGWDDLDNERRGGYGDFSGTGGTGGTSGASSSGSESVTRMKTASELMKDGSAILVDGFFETLGLSGTALTDSSKLNGADGSSVRVTESIPNEPSAAERAAGAVVSEPTPATEKQVALDSGVVYDPAKGAGQWDPVVLEALGRVAGSPANLGRAREQIGIESTGNPDAINNSDSNAAAGDPTVGLLQMKGSTFAHYRDPELPDDRRNPLANITGALRYVDDVYGAPEKIWPTVKGYRDGGKVTGGRGGIDDIFAKLTADEFVVKAERARANMPALEAINAGADVSVGGGGSTTYAPVLTGIGTEQVFALFEQWMREHERKGVRAKTSRRR